MLAQTSLQKRVEKQKEHANRNLTGWFLRKFSKKTQYLRDQDEESAQADRMRRHMPASTSGHSQSGHSTSSSASATSHAKPRHISAVAAAASRNDPELNRPTPQRQRSFLRAQLLEMKRESAETLLSAQQKRMAGEVVDEVPRFGTQLGIDNSDDEDYALDESEDDDLDSVRSVDELDDALQELSAAEFRAIRKEKWLRKKSRMLEAAEAEATRMDRAGSGQRRSSHGSSQRRSSHGSSRGAGGGGDNDDNDDSDADDDSDKENDASAIELNRRISRATQMYAEALSQIDHALHPSEHPLEPQPLYLGAKKAGHRPKSEWI